MLAGDPEVVVVGECSGVDGAAIVESKNPDILFLDISMPLVDGFDLLEQIGIDRAPTVVFVTAHADHAMRAFEVHAIDYLLKPIDDSRFAQALGRAKSLARLRRSGDTDPHLGALRRERTRTTKRILVRDRGKTKVIDVDAIDWIEAADYYAVIHTGGETHLLRETLNQLAERLDPDRFFRVHRSAIVHLDRIKEIHPLFHGDRELVLGDATRIRLSRTRREEFERLFTPARRTP